MKIKEIKSNNQVFHPFDKAFKIIIDYCPDFAFEYLGISGDFIHLCKNNFIGSDSTEYFLDSVFLVMAKNGDNFEEFIIDLEHQSSHVTLEKLKTLNLYSVHASYYFVKPVVSIVLTDVDSYNKSIKEYEIADYLIHKPLYIYFTKDKIRKKLKNILLKCDSKITISDMEAMDIAFLPIISPRDMRKEITKILARSFNKFIIKNERIAYVILQVLKLLINYFFEGDELIELSGMINMEFEEAIEKLFDPRFNELNDEVYQLNQKLKLANEEKDIALSNARLANEEKDIALSNARLANEEKDIALSNVKLLKEEHNHLIEVLNNLIKQGKLSKEDLYLAGIIL